MNVNSLEASKEICCDAIICCAVKRIFIFKIYFDYKKKHFCLLAGISSRHDTTSPTDTACSSESPAFISNATTNSLLYDQHSSEEELEVIYGQSSEDNVDHSDELFSEALPQRSSSTIIENRKRSLPQSSDDEVSILSLIFNF